MPDRFRPEHGVPDGQGWVGSQTFLGEGVEQCLEERTLEYDGRDRIAASMVFHDYAALLISPVIAHALINNTILDARPANTSVHLDGATFGKVAAFGDWPEPPDAAAPLQERLDTAKAALAPLIATQLEPLMATLRACCRIASRTLWLDIAHLIAGSTRVVAWSGFAGPIGTGDAAQLLTVDPHLANGALFRTLDAYGSQWLFHKRLGCCLKYKLPHNRCPPCPLNSDDENRDLYHNSVDKFMAGTLL